MHPDDVKLIKSLHERTGLPYEEIKQAFADAQGDGDKLLQIIEEKVKQHLELAHHESELTLGRIIVFIISRILARTLLFGLGLSVLVVILGIGLKGASFSSALKSVPYCFGFAFIVAVLFAFSKEF